MEADGNARGRRLHAHSLGPRALPGGGGSRRARRGGGTGPRAGDRRRGRYAGDRRPLRRRVHLLRGNPRAAAPAPRPAGDRVPAGQRRAGARHRQGGEDHARLRRPGIRARGAVRQPRRRSLSVPPILSDRLELVSMSAASIEALLDDYVDEASRLLNATVPDDLISAEADFFRLRLGQMQRDPSLQEWLVRAVVLRETREAVGHAGFHGKPGTNGKKDPTAVEVG